MCGQEFLLFSNIFLCGLAGDRVGSLQNLESSVGNFLKITIHLSRIRLCFVQVKTSSGGKLAVTLLMIESQVWGGTWGRVNWIGPRRFELTSSFLSIKYKREVVRSCKERSRSCVGPVLPPNTPLAVRNKHGLSRVFICRVWVNKLFALPWTLNSDMEFQLSPYSLLTVGLWSGPFTH